MAEHDASFGGELSGHFYFRDNFYADSGAMAFAAVVSALAGSEETMSQQISPHRTYSQSGEINFETPDKDAAMAMLVDAFPEAKVDRLDGVTIDCGDWWCNVRASNTEPLLRLNLEASTGDEVAVRVVDCSKYLGTRVDH
jgi:phosphomannomutase